MIFKAEVIRALKWTVIGRFSTQIVSWVITILLIRLLMPGDYGLMAMATVFSGLFALVAEIGLGSSLVQSTDVSERQMRQVFAIVLLSNFAIFVVLVVGVAPLAALFFREPRLETIIQVVALQFVPAAFAVIPGAMLHREMLYAGRSAVEFVSSLCGSVLTLGLAYKGYGAWSLAWGGVLAATLRATGYVWLKPYNDLPLFDFKGCGQIVRFGRDVAANQLLFHFYSQADSLIVGKLLGRHDLGLYSVSMDLASLPASRLASILNQVAFPAMSKVKRDGGDVSPYVLKSIRGISLLSFPVMWGISSVSPEIIEGVLGNRWEAATMPLCLLSLIMPFRVLGPIIHAALQSVGRADISFRNTCFAAVVMCLAFVFGCQFGLVGLAWSWVVAFPAVFFANVARSCPYIDLRFKEVAAALSRPALVSGIMYAVVAMVRQLINLDPLSALSVLVVIGGATYIAGSLCFNRCGVSEAINLIRPVKQYS